MMRTVSKWLLVPPRPLLLKYWYTVLEFCLKYHTVIFENVVVNQAPWLDDLGGPRKILVAWASTNFDPYYVIDVSTCKVFSSA